MPNEGLLRELIHNQAGTRATAGRRLRRMATQLGPGRTALTLFLLLFALLFARFSWQIPLVIDAERALYDMRATVGAPHIAQDPRIVMVTYTDETLFNTGIRSPVDRAILARALAQLDGMGARSIGIDILFDSPTASDDALRAQLRAMRTPTFVAFAEQGSNPNNIQYEQTRFLNAFLQSVTTQRTRPASIRLETDGDDVVRRWPGLPAGSPALLTTAMAGPAADGGAERWHRFVGAIRFRMPAQVAAAGGGVETREVFAKLPIDNFANPEFAPFLAGEIRGRHVLIGGDIVDEDEFATPLSRLPDPASGEQKPMIGLEVHANLLAQVLDGVMPRGIHPATLWLAACLAVLGGVVTALVNLRPFASAMLIAVQLLAIAALPFALHMGGTDTLTIPVAGWGGGWVLGFIAATTAIRAVGAEERAFAQSALGKYLPRDIAQQILRDPDRLALHGEKRLIYCLFSDLEGFTKMSHAITPENVAKVLNAYLDTLSNVVLAHGGTIDKFVGDAVVAFWGAPIARPDDGDQATRALLAMAAAGDAFSRRIQQELGADIPPIGRTRVGLHYGEAVVGNFGGEGRIQYTALGDSMNTASRLEAANKQTKTRALASAEAVAGSSLDCFVPMGRVQLRGRARPVEVYEPRPDLSVERRAQVAALVAAHDAGKGDTFERIAADISDWAAADPAIANLMQRLYATSAGEYYALG